MAQSTYTMPIKECCNLNKTEIGAYKHNFSKINVWHCSKDRAINLHDSWNGLTGPWCKLNINTLYEIEKKSSRKKKVVILLVLLVEISEINNQILDHKHVRERGYNSGPGSVRINGLETCRSLGPINIHSTWPTDSFSARPPIAQAWIVLCFYLLWYIQNLHKVSHPAI